ncbi:Macro domain-containing protein [Seminavis robusta]|uniref:Macro domain-containing protein n=1 Tax=Seminavis robusta TaxID=568900 RepID=A0A9N8DN96_9STRA|nr:Macro domain-containing protein [Seminavis robusta]|eukprot:Sro173_g076160.1 Macro domain-containing protein (259) ;mRNA; f:11877-13404
MQVFPSPAVQHIRSRANPKPRIHDPSQTHHHSSSSLRNDETSVLDQVVPDTTGVTDTKDPSVIGELLHPNGKTKIVAKAGSLLDYVGDAIVNAANEGCVGGFGIDEMINRAAGNYEIKEARKKLGGCPTGQAKSTGSFQLKDKCRYIIHAVGPVYRRKLGQPEPDFERLDGLLRSAYRSALQEAGKLRVETLGFCILSAGVFRGERDLQDLIAIAMEALMEDNPDFPGSVSTITVYAYTPEEQAAMAAVVGGRTSSAE